MIRLNGSEEEREGQTDPPENDHPSCDLLLLSSHPLNKHQTSILSHLEGGEEGRSFIPSLWIISFHDSIEREGSERREENNTAVLFSSSREGKKGGKKKGKVEDNRSVCGRRRREKVRRSVKCETSEGVKGKARG